MLRLLIGANAIIILVFAFAFKRLPPQIPLLYSRPWGENQLVDTWIIFLLPALLNFFYVANNYFYKKFFFNNQLVKKIFFYLNILLIIGFALIFIKIIFLVS